MSEKVYKIVIDSLLRNIKEKKVLPWENPFLFRNEGLPRRLSTGKPYQGSNMIILAFIGDAKGYSSPFWGTFKQWSKIGGTIKAGEHGEPVVYWGNSWTDGEHWGQSPDDFEEPDDAHRVLIARYYKVWNMDQVDLPNLDQAPAWLKEWKKPTGKPSKKGETKEAKRIADLIRKMVPVLEDQNGRGFYRGATDEIHLAPMSKCKSKGAYYMTLFHEGVHATGHEKRLNRPGIGVSKGTEEYGLEELIAETGACMLTAQSGIKMENYLERSADYIAGWVSAIEKDPKIFISGASKSRKAVEYILAVDQKKEA